MVTIVDVNTWRVALTLCCVGLFFAIGFWAYGRGRKNEFAQIAQSIVDDCDGLSAKAKPHQPSCCTKEPMA